ncbi:hypothetical protein K458DRAFT_383439 [Lentithecium fluviatile CBS 122367]|uniref:Nucleic acid-binding protein n=1 Tax=Lentithecium fluviatile CBS 122367 TaxID=1168545 RepID=A0A6G1JJC0_9PLEO|nr:hypothetical protein K458DRAFT_383439 [Lentithecium fluviatile CBS 122367]
MRLKTLNGAPLCENLDFGAENLLDAEALARCLHDPLYQPPSEKNTAPNLKWRRLTPKDTRLRTGWSQPYLPEGALHGSNPDLSFSVPEIEGPLDLPSDDTTILDQTVTLLDNTVGIDDFVQHSLIFHDTLLSSQIAADDAADRTVSSFSLMGTSFETMSTDMESQPQEASQGPILRILSTLMLTPLGSLPSADYLRSIYPQTPTPNFLCVLTAQPNDREVFVKKGGYRMSLREITVADDTKSGFTISFWNRPSGRGDSQNSVAQTLDRVRAGDILLLRNIALNAFRDNVYGQSLNPSITRVRTTVEILKSSSGISSRQLGALPAAVVATFVRVKRWASAHVASDTSGLRKRKGGMEASSRSTKHSLRSYDHDESLPPDTMEAT